MVPEIKVRPAYRLSKSASEGQLIPLIEEEDDEEEDVDLPSIPIDTTDEEEEPTLPPSSPTDGTLPPPTQPGNEKETTTTTPSTPTESPSPPTEPSDKDQTLVPSPEPSEPSNCCDFEIEPGVPIPLPRPGTRIIRLDASDLISAAASQPSRATKESEKVKLLRRELRQQPGFSFPLWRKNKWYSEASHTIVNEDGGFAIDAAKYRALVKATAKESAMGFTAPSQLQKNPLATLVRKAREVPAPKLIVELDKQAKSHKLSLNGTRVRFLDELSFAIVDIPASLTGSQAEAISHSVLMNPAVSFVEPDTPVRLLDSVTYSDPSRQFPERSQKRKDGPRGSKVVPVGKASDQVFARVSSLDIPAGEEGGILGDDDQAAELALPKQECLRLETEELVFEAEDQNNGNVPKIASFVVKTPASETEKLIEKPNDPLWPYQWYLYWVNAHKAWRTHRGDEDGAYRPIVCIVDTGIDYTHPDIKENLWINEAEYYGKPGVDDDGNGYIDDIYGINAVLETGDPMDDNSHGTHCAGVVGAAGDNKLGIVGVNRNALLMGCKFLGSDGGGAVSNAVKCIDYAMKTGVSVLSNSWGGGGSRSLREAVARSRRKGIIFIAAAGNLYQNNDVLPTYPANYDSDNIVSIASVDQRGLSPFSNYGVQTVHVAAPGSAILSTVRNESYATLSGTSMACPAVAGLASLIKSASPDLNYKEIKEAMRISVRPFANLDQLVKWAGVVDHEGALEVVAGPSWYRPVPSWSAFLKPIKLNPGEHMLIPIAFYGIERRFYSSNFTVFATTEDSKDVQSVTIPVSLIVNAFPRLNTTAIPRDLTIPGLQYTRSVPVRIPLRNRGSGVLRVDIETRKLGGRDEGDLIVVQTGSEIREADDASFTVQCSMSDDASTFEVTLYAHEGAGGKEIQLYTIFVTCAPYSMSLIPSQLVVNSIDHQADLQQQDSTEEAPRMKMESSFILSIIQDDKAEAVREASRLQPTLDALVQHIPRTRIRRAEEWTNYKPRVWLSKRFHFVDITKLAQPVCADASTQVLANFTRFIDNDLVTDFDQLVYSWKFKDEDHKGWKLSELISLRNADDGRQSFVFETFRFRFFGVEYDTIYVSPNGFFAFADWEHTHDWNPTLLSEETPSGVIAPLWMDFVLDDAKSGVFVLETPTLAIVQWNLLSSYSDTPKGTYTFQTLLLKTGDIIFSYKEATNIDSGSIGIKSMDNSVRKKAPNHRLSVATLKNGNIVYSPTTVTLPVVNTSAVFAFADTGASYDLASVYASIKEFKFNHTVDVDGDLEVFLLNPTTNELSHQTIPFVQR